MSTHLYHPSPEDIERVRRHVSMNSAYYESGQPMPGRHGRNALYPRGFTSFAQQVGVNMRQLSRILNGGGTKRSTWARIEAQVNVHDETLEDELLEVLRRIRGELTELESRLVARIQ